MPSKPMTDVAEYYFIQLLFCKNRDLLCREYRDIYDVMLTRYEKIYNEGQEARVDLEDINEKFMQVFKRK